MGRGTNTGYSLEHGLWRPRRLVRNIPEWRHSKIHGGIPLAINDSGARPISASPFFMEKERSHTGKP